MLYPVAQSRAAAVNRKVLRFARERWFALLTERQLRPGVHRSTKELKAAIHDFIENHNRDPKPFIWHKTADQILDSVARFCKRINDSGH